jgi:hypothetical protein
VGWTINGPIAQSLQGARDPSLQASFYAPVIGFLDRAERNGPLRIEEVFTRSHWDAAVLGSRYSLARGWERQLDTEYAPLFYRLPLTTSSYRAWLQQTAVRYVVMSDAPLDDSSRAEAALIRHGVPYLRLVFAGAHWRVYAVIGHQPLLSGPGRLTSLTADGFSVWADGPGPLVVRVRYTPYWSVDLGSACVSQAAGGWTQVLAEAPGPVRVTAQLSLAKILGSDPACAPGPAATA